MNVYSMFCFMAMHLGQFYSMNVQFCDLDILRNTYINMIIFSNELTQAPRRESATATFHL